MRGDLKTVVSESRVLEQRVLWRWMCKSRRVLEPEELDLYALEPMDLGLYLIRTFLAL